MRQRILIADDEQTVQTVLARALESEPYDLLTASNGRTAVNMASAQTPDIVLLDINMPEKNGWEVLKELRHNTRTRMIPVIMLTGCGSISDKVGGLEMGADDYVTKPFEITELKARIAGALRRNRLDLSANPLTRLPGSPTIEEEVNRRIRESIPFAFLYIDINHFKSYNDSYGFERGDRVIRATAEVLLESLRIDQDGEGFIGHIGGDDFVAITDPVSAPHLAQRIVARFDKLAAGFYNRSDRARGHINIKNRRGYWERFPIISLSIGAATTQHRALEHYAKVVQIASEMKAYCKADQKHCLSRFAFDRRTDSKEDRGRLLWTSDGSIIRAVPKI